MAVSAPWAGMGSTVRSQVRLAQGCGEFLSPTLRWALAPSSPVTGRAIDYWSCQLDPLPIEIASKSVETRTLQGQHLVCHPSIICAGSVAEPSMWGGDQGWTTASITFPLAPQSACIWAQEKVPGFSVPGEEQGQPVTERDTKTLHTHCQAEVRSKRSSLL